MKKKPRLPYLALSLMLFLLLVTLFFFDLPLSYKMQNHYALLKPVSTVLNSLVKQSSVLTINVLLFFIFRFAFSFFSIHILFFHMLVTQCLGQLVVRIIKVVVGRARPYWALNESVTHFSPFSFLDQFHSLPSGHSLVIFIVASSLSYQWPKWKIFFFATAAIFALCRFALLQHFLSDITLSLIIALILSKCVHYFSYQIVEKNTLNA